jgi:hypothetical protein
MFMDGPDHMMDGPVKNSVLSCSRVYLVGSEAQELLVVIAVPFHYRSLGGTRWDADGVLF